MGRGRRSLGRAWGRAGVGEPSGDLHARLGRRACAAAPPRPRTAAREAEDGPQGAGRGLSRRPRAAARALGLAPLADEEEVSGSAAPGPDRSNCRGRPPTWTSSMRAPGQPRGRRAGRRGSTWERGDDLVMKRRREHHLAEAGCVPVGTTGLAASRTSAAPSRAWCTTSGRSASSAAAIARRQALRQASAQGAERAPVDSCRASRHSSPPPGTAPHPRPRRAPRGRARARLEPQGTARRGPRRGVLPVAPRGAGEGSGSGRSRPARSLGLTWSTFTAGGTRWLRPLLDSPS